MVVDYGSGVNISYDALVNMHYKDDDIQVTHGTFKAFYSYDTIPIGLVKIPIIIGLVMLITSCVVFNQPMDFNILLGHHFTA